MRIAALRRHLPELNDTIARMQAEVERGGIRAHVYETALSGLIGIEIEWSGNLRN
jgi:hypothetical protein